MFESIQGNSNLQKKSRSNIVFIILFVIALIVFVFIPKTAKKEKAIDSNDLEHTTFVATFDSNIPEHKNVIWCVTFQMAWDKLKNDIIKEPVQLIDAQDFADELNKSEYFPGNLDANSYYTAAGFVEDGIINAIKTEMAKRFPDELLPTFIEGYYNLPNPILAYAYLNANIKFKYPFFTYKEAFTFVNSNNEETNVTAFCLELDQKGVDINYIQILGQVQVLYYEHGQDKKTNYFAVDLCKYTEPYQVILALIPQKNTFEEMISDVENKIGEYKNELWYLPDFYDADKFIVPDIFCNLNHHYKEVLDKKIANKPWKSDGYYIFDAMQTIDFSLNKSGVSIKSHGRLAVAAGGIPEPRYLYFNRPFLVYAQKREPGSKPFFAMWIDNAEVMIKSN